jgi:hypothetical protein
LQTPNPADPERSRAEILAQLTEENRARLKAARHVAAAFRDDRWEGAEVEVLLDDGWHRWLGLPKLPMTEMLARSEALFGGLAQRMIGEDLTGTMDGLKVPFDPDELTLLLEPLDGGARFSRRVRMSADNRSEASAQALAELRDARLRREQQIADNRSEASAQALAELRDARRRREQSGDH